MKKKERKIWLITDTHFNHANMIPYCNRPKGFTELIFKNLKEMVGEDDLLIHLGDVCIGGDQEVHRRLQLMSCKKWLLLGNHDRKSRSWYLDNGWDFVGYRFSDEFFGKKILFSHLPTKDTGLFDMNIFGHFHNQLKRLQKGEWVVEGERERNIDDLSALTDKHKLLVIEFTDYKPVLLENFIKT